ncbi:MAG: hypothetical protein ABIH21_01120 [Patescibacteria group bacterium]
MATKRRRINKEEFFRLMQVLADLVKNALSVSHKVEDLGAIRTTCKSKDCILTIRAHFPNKNVGVFGALVKRPHDLFIDFVDRRLNDDKGLNLFSYMVDFADNRETTFWVRVPRGSTYKSVKTQAQEYGLLEGTDVSNTRPHCRAQAISWSLGEEEAEQILRNMFAKLH